MKKMLILGLILILLVFGIFAFYIFIIREPEVITEEPLTSTYTFQDYKVPRIITDFMGRKLIGYLSFNTIIQIDTYFKITEFTSGYHPSADNNYIKASFLNETNRLSEIHEINLCKVCDCFTDISLIPVFEVDKTYTIEEINEILDK